MNELPKAESTPRLFSSRRACLKSSLGILGGSMLLSDPAAAQTEVTNKRPLVISTWPFGKPANEVSVRKIMEGGTTLDAVEAGIRQAEGAGISSVGLSGQPNAAGFVQQDACIMHGPDHQAGSVAAVEGVVHPITVARRVLERSPHVMLVGEGAREFAIHHRCETLNIQEHQTKMTKWREKHSRKPPVGSQENHDTIALLVLGADGTISGGCSTSGLGGKHPGRVGDSPILGSGLYVDNQVGAAGATGVGENVMRYCATFLIVEFMRAGFHPTAACQKAIRRIASMDPKRDDLAINFVALNKQGQFGAAGTDKFPYSVTYPGFSQVLTKPATQL